jgi:acyl-CoA reductase-like NAD-dependent aldehyde dehydrogenase
MIDVELLIDGVGVAAHARGTFERRSPVTGEVVTRAAAATAEDAASAVQAAARAFPGWASLGPNARRGHLLAAASGLRARSGEFAECIRAETGATLGWGHFNVAFAASMLEEAASITSQVAGELIPSDQPGTLAMAQRRPAGVVLGMAPWNAPVILGVRALALPLACGNTVVLKASEMCPATHRLIGDVMTDAGMPAGVVNVLTHSAQDAPALVEAMIANPAVRRVSFTGSTRVGRIVGELCGRHLKQAVLELGGKAPLVVLDDADLEQAVNAAAFGGFMHQGQICMSTERVVVQDGVADAFVARFAAKAGSLRAGDPHTGDFPLGAMVDARSVEHVRGLIDDALAKGATLAAGGRTEGVFIAPTVLDHVTAQMRIYREESFGPVVAVMRVRDDEQAIAVANDTDYGLSAAVFGRDVARALAVAERIESGICHVNSPTVQDEAQMPFGGTKASGYGRFGSRAAIDHFTELRWITVARQPRHYPF